MKKLVFVMLLALATVAMVGCEKEPAGGSQPGTTPDTPSKIEVVGTSWQGVCNTSMLHPEMGNLFTVLTWTFDFLDETNVSIMLEIVVGGQRQPAQELDCTYSFDGEKGALYFDEDSVAIVGDLYNNSLTMDLQITSGFSAEEPQLIGGPTTFYRIR